jgi:AraC-like DNA-binding protein
MKEIELLSRSEIPEVGVHKACPCYQNDEGQTFQQYPFMSGESRSITLKAHHLLFVMEGSVRMLVHNGNRRRTLVREEFICLPIGTKLEYEALEPGFLLMIRLDRTSGEIPECHTFRIQRAYRSPIDRDSGLYPLQTNERIRYFLNGLLLTERDGLKCSSYARLLVGQLMYLIQVYYTQEEYSRFYATLFTSDVVLSDFVYQNWNKYATVNDLATAFGISVRQFTVRFQKIFGESPGSWIKRSRAADIYHDICSSHKTLKSIAIEHNFSMSNFIRFCRMNFNQSPGAIRKQLMTSTHLNSFIKTKSDESAGEKSHRKAVVVF